MDLSVNTSSTYAAGSSKSALKSFAKKTDNTSNTTKAADTAAVYEKTTTEKKDSVNMRQIHLIENFVRIRFFGLAKDYIAIGIFFQGSSVCKIRKDLILKKTI